MRLTAFLLLLVCASRAHASISLSGSSQYIQAGTAVVTIEPLTLACWFRPANTTADGVLMMLDNATSANSGFRLLANGASASDPILASTVGSGTQTATSTAGYTSGAWHHATAVFASRSSRRVLLDGGNAATNSTDAGTVTTPNRTEIGARLNSGSAGVFFAGDVAEVAVWSAALTDDEARALSLGVSPLLVRPQALVLYIPGVRTVADFRGAASLTDNGPSTVADHPRVFSAER